MYPVYYSINLIWNSCKFYDRNAKDVKSKMGPSIKTNNSWRKYVLNKKNLALLKVLEACIECAPQLILQIYVFRLESHQNCFDENEKAFGFLPVREFQDLDLRIFKL